MSMKLAAITVFIFAVQLSSCAMVKKAGHQNTNERGIVAPKMLVATDFVNALKQLDHLQPDQATIDLQSSDREDSFTLAMHDALRLAGYGIRWVQRNDTLTLFEYRQSAEHAAASTSQEFYEISIGAVDMRRGYAVDGKHRVKPVTPLYLRGVAERNIVLNDDIFNGARAHTANASILTARPASSIPTSDQQNGTALKVPDEANPLDLLVASATANKPQIRQSANVMRTENVFDLGESNFEMMLSGHSIVAEKILIFANDSMRLGDLNKQLVRQIVKIFNPNTDVFSVTGCSMGPTVIDGGNAALALGRAGRVVEALRFSGVDDKQIFDEGCWAGNAKIERMPARGVVLTLNRQR